MAMTFYESAPAMPKAPGIMDTILDRLFIGTKRVQKSRMQSALMRLTSDQLATIGITRADIPAYAHACINGN